MSSVGFIEGIRKHLDTFASSSGVNVDEVHVRLTLADGVPLILRGLKVTEPAVAGGQGWGMIHGTDPASAVVVRESHVLKAEFQLAPQDRRPIGLHTEGGKPTGL
jgi:hypothetical protein